MRVPTAKLLRLEQGGALRWLIPFGATLRGERPPAPGAVFEIEEPSGAVFTCRLEPAHGDRLGLRYVGPPRPRHELRAFAALLRHSTRTPATARSASPGNP